MTIWSAEIKEVERLFESLRGRIPDLEKELERLIRADDENIVLVYSRRCLEVIITELYESELQRPRKTEPLKGIIDKLLHEEKVPAYIITSMHGLNELSNYGAHPKEFDPQQVRSVLINLETVLRWFMKYKDIEIVSVSKTFEEEKEAVTKGEDYVFKVEQKTEKPKTTRKSTDKSIYKRPQVWATSLVVFITILIIIFQIFYRKKVRWANEKAIQEIEQSINELNFSAAFNLIQEAGRYISKDKNFRKLASFAKTKVTFLTDPPGARILIREYNDSLGKWKKLGTTPIDSVELPNYSFYLMRIEKPGYENILAVAPTSFDTIYRKLFVEGTVPPGMVYVEGYLDEVKNVFIKDSCGFFMDRYEVTNKEFKEFVDKGGYSKPEYWKNKFIKDGKILSWEEAIAEFKDRSGRPGPSTWEGSDYPEGQDDWPVSGISWYEAAAYAEYAGKDLPTADHWDSGAGFNYDFIYNNFGSRLFLLSNFNGKGPQPVGKCKGINYYGAYDMAGNVREWCWNETQSGRIICGGGWDDANYMYIMWSQLPPFDRSSKNGLRCVKYINKEKIPESAFRSIEFNEGRDYSRAEPVSDDIFKIFKNQFLYDSTALNPVVEKKDTNDKNWILEKITFNAAYGNERVILYLYLPKNASPPYQTIVFFPGSYALQEKDPEQSIISNWFIDYIVKNGRALAFPVYKGTFQRIDDLTGGLAFNYQSHSYTELFIKWVKDFSRTIDYLETCPDFDISKIGFYGHSWGGFLGGIIPAVEKRVSVDILVVGGFDIYYNSFPEADAINYVTRIKIPVLMMNGRYDMRIPLEKAVRPFFDLLGTPEQDKRLCVYETDHYVPKNEMIKETLNFLDKYWGPPGR